VSVTQGGSRTSVDDRIEAKRQIIRESLPEIKAEIEDAIRTENLHVPVGISVPSRYSVVTVRRPPNMTSKEWSRMSAIVSQIVGRKLGGKGLRSGRPLANSQMGTARLAQE